MPNMLGRASVSSKLLFSISIVLSAFVGLMNGVEVCMECRPIELLEGPGVGLSLAPAYGAASVQFANGTTHDVAILTGSEAYISAMKHWQQLDTGGYLLNVRKLSANAAASDLHNSPQPGLQSFTMWIRSLLHNTYFSPIPAARKASDFDNELLPIAGMLQDLFRMVSDFSPLKYTRVRLVVPDFVQNGSDLASCQIRPMLEMAGLDGFHSSFQVRCRAALLGFYNVTDCFGIPRYVGPDYPSLDRDSHEGRMIVNGVTTGPEDPDLECQSYRGRSIQKVLSIQIDEQSLSFRTMIREDGYFFLDLGTSKLLWKATDENSTDDTQYWQWVKDELHMFMKTEELSVDLLLLSGTAVLEPEFQDIIQDAFEDNDKIVKAEYLKARNDHVFADARAAAYVARQGMCTDFDGCMPNRWCPRSKYCEKWQWSVSDEDKGKSEL